MSDEPCAVGRFVGEICGFGTLGGRRCVIGRWVRSPFGPIADAMVEDATGRRTLIVPTAEVGRYIADVYRFDEVVVTPVVAGRTDDRLRFAGGPLEADIAIGGRDLVGWLLRAVPARIAAHYRWAAMIEPLVARVLPGVHTRGRTSGGVEFYGATDRHRVAGGTARWVGTDLGELGDVHPPVRFGFSSTPRRPSLVAVTTTIHRAAGP